MNESHLSHKNNTGSHPPRNSYRSQNQRSSQQSIRNDVELSSITKHLTEQALLSVTTRETTPPKMNYNVRLQGIASNETLTVGFYDSENDSSSNTTTNMCDYHHSNRIILQCGKVGTTIVITRIQLRFVASPLPRKQFLSLKPLSYSLRILIYHLSLPSTFGRNKNFVPIFIIVGIFILRILYFLVDGLRQ